LGIPFDKNPNQIEVGNEKQRTTDNPNPTSILLQEASMVDYVDVGTEN
jgi:hypothetical protein